MRYGFLVCESLIPGASTSKPIACVQKDQHAHYNFRLNLFPHYPKTRMHSQGPYQAY